ncbi:FG-GAP repeat domain-containing protein [Edaphobacter aggregans]|uniref:FG-GAP repeat domain-containing protein n=1 Tax=Edaphobacter aggregans TaxID=570835 RepID=UPI00146FF4A7|nr:FG-GAP and VCBS repeat-containing protein [Edaphobacter aggregans]
MKLRILLVVCLLPLFAASLLAQSQQPIFPTLGTYNSLPVYAGVVGDFNGDGLPDFAYYRLSAPQGPIDLVTLLNQGGDNDPVVVSTPFNCNGATSFSLTTADMNKDGKLDLVQTCNGYVVVVLGNGDGSFQIPSNTAYYSVSGATLSAVVPPVDLNGDGYPDVVANANATVGGASSVAVFLNQGSPSPRCVSQSSDLRLPE